MKPTAKPGRTPWVKKKCHNLVLNAAQINPITAQSEPRAMNRYEGSNQLSLSGVEGETSAN